MKPTYQQLQKENEKLRKQLFEKSKITESMLLKNIMHASTEMSVVATDIDLNLIFFNKKAEQIFGYKAKDVIGKNLTEIHEMEKVEFSRIEQAIEIVKRTGKYEYFVETNINNETKHYKSIVNGIWNNTKILVGFVLFTEDITDRKKAKQELKASEEDYKLLIETMKDVVIRISTKGKLLYVSPAIKDFGGYIPEEEVGIIMLKYFAKKTDFIRATKLIAKVLLTHKSGNFEFLFNAKNKTPFAVELTYAPLIKDDKVYAIQMILRDISERKKTEQALKESNKTKDKFFSIIAHDLRSPFNAMLGFSDLLLNNFDNYSQEEQKQFLGYIDKSIKKANNFLDDLLTWARTQQKKINFKPEKENLFLLSSHTTDILKHSIEKKNIEITNQVAHNLFAKVDKNMILTVFRNLLSNAIKFTEKGGKITLTSNNITDKNKQKYIQITVKDTGVGISKERQSKLFDISENTTTSGTEDEIGTGLGLPICKEFIKKHGGKTWFESEIGKGSIFHFTVPL